MPFFHYIAHGLVVESDRPVRGLAIESEGRAPDILLRMSEWPAALDRALASAPGRVLYEMPGERGPQMRVTALSGVDGPAIRQEYSNGRASAEFLIEERGHRIWARASETRPENLGVLLGPALGCALRLRGTTCLHASTVLVDGRVVALAGNNGAGKSTTVTELSRRGFQVFGDDLVALAEDEGRFLAHAGTRQVRLRPDAAERLFGSADALPRIWDVGGARAKRAVESGDLRDALTPAPLAAVYILTPGGSEAGETRIEPLSGAAALMALVPQIYLTLSVGGLERERDFAVLGRLATAVPIRRVVRAESLEHVGRTCERILDDLRQSNP